MSMHIQYTNPQFGDAFFSRFDEMKSLWDTHPILSQKQSLLDSMNAGDVKTLPQVLSDFVHLVQTQEKPLLESLKFSVKSDKQYSLDHETQTLHDDHKEFVQKHQSTFSSVCTDSFTKLIEYAVVSDTKAYGDAMRDYVQFQRAVDGYEQLNQLFAHVDSQLYLAKKIQTKLTGQAHSVHEDVTDLVESHESQIGIMARLPQFRFS